MRRKRMKMKNFKIEILLHLFYLISILRTHLSNADFASRKGFVV